MPLTLRLSLTYLLVTLAGMLLLGALSLALFRNYLDAQRDRELAALTQLYADLLRELADDADAFAALAASAPQRALLPPDVAVRVFSAGGALLSASEDLGPFPSRPARALIRSPLPLPVSQAELRRYAAVPVGVTSLFGVVELSRSTAEERAMLAELQRFGLQAALLAAALMALMSWLVARSIARPIVALSAHADALAHNAGQARPQQRLGEREDEIGLLARSLDQLAQELRGQIISSEGERRQLDAVLGAISEGVLALDEQGHPIYANIAARRILASGGGGLEPKDVWLGDRWLSTVLAAREVKEYEVQSGAQTMLVTTFPIDVRSAIGQLPSAVVVLRDITQLRALEMARTRLVRSVSHELRTPLTAILGTVENLRDDAARAQLPALDLIEGEAARLSRLVDELLKTPDAAMLTIERRRLDLVALVVELCRLQQGRAHRAGITLDVRAEADLPTIEGDRDRIKQAVLNVLDNALRYTPPGGTVAVTVGRAPQGQALRIKVVDNGPGVDPSLAATIWQRGVAGPAGGSGLGLAIVREIVGAHSGRAWLEPGPGGAHFVVELPLHTGTE
jgi:signal transduction histidine kinase/HAMP domain-containing protein